MDPVPFPLDSTRTIDPIDPPEWDVISESLRALPIKEQYERSLQEIVCRIGDPGDGIELSEEEIDAVDLAICRRCWVGWDEFANKMWWLGGLWENERAFAEGNPELYAEIAKRIQRYITKHHAELPPNDNAHTRYAQTTRNTAVINERFGPYGIYVCRVVIGNPYTISNAVDLWRHCADFVQRHPNVEEETLRLAFRFAVSRKRELGSYQKSKNRRAPKQRAEPPAPILPISDFVRKLNESSLTEARTIQGYYQLTQQDVPDADYYLKHLPEQEDFGWVDEEAPFEAEEFQEPMNDPPPEFGAGSVGREQEQVEEHMGDPILGAHAGGTGGAEDQAQESMNDLSIGAEGAQTRREQLHEQSIPPIPGHSANDVVPASSLLTSSRQDNSTDTVGMLKIHPEETASLDRMRQDDSLDSRHFLNIAHGRQVAFDKPNLTLPWNIMPLMFVCQHSDMYVSQNTIPKTLMEIATSPGFPLTHWHVETVLPGSMIEQIHTPVKVAELDNHAIHGTRSRQLLTFERYRKSFEMAVPCPEYRCERTHPALESIATRALKHRFENQQDRDRATAMSNIIMDSVSLYRHETRANFECNIRSAPYYLKIDHGIHIVVYRQYGLEKEWQATTLIPTDGLMMTPGFEFKVFSLGPSIMTVTMHVPCLRWTSILGEVPSRETAATAVLTSMLLRLGLLRDAMGSISPKGDTTLLLNYLVMCRPMFWAGTPVSQLVDGEILLLREYARE